MQVELTANEFRQRAKLWVTPPTDRLRFWFWESADRRPMLGSGSSPKILYSSRENYWDTEQDTAAKLPTNSNSEQERWRALLPLVYSSVLCVCPL